MARIRATEQRVQQLHVDVQRLLKLLQALQGQARGTTDDIIGETPTGGIIVPVYTAGCGIDITAYAVSVDTTDLIGDGLVAGADCLIEVNPGCGLEIATGAVQVKIADLMGDGLEAGATGCLIDVKTGCGIEIATGAVAVKRADLLGVGLKAGASGCLIAVDYDCGLTVSGNALIVDNAALQGSGLAATGTCALQVATGCGLVFGTPSGGITPLEVDCRDFIDGVSITATLVSGCYVAAVDDDYIEGAIEDYLNSEAGQALLEGKIADYLASTAGCQAIVDCASANCDIECNEVIEPEACVGGTPSTLCVRIIDTGIPSDTSTTYTWNSGTSDWEDGGGNTVDCSGANFIVTHATYGTYTFPGFGVKFLTVGTGTIELSSGTCP